MSKSSSKIGMKFRRFFYKLGKYSMFVITVITCYNITKHLLEIRAERIKKEKLKHNLIAAFSIVSWIIAIAAIFAVVIKYLKYLKKGYLLDLFDTEEYDVIEPDEENPAESIIRSELRGSDELDEHEKLTGKHIPLDEDACEDDYN